MNDRIVGLAMTLRIEVDKEFTGENTSTIKKNRSHLPTSQHRYALKYWIHRRNTRDSEIWKKDLLRDGGLQYNV